MAVPFQSAPEFARYLDSLGFFHMDLGLGRMKQALQALGLSRPPCCVVQVAGTNGKGSTASFLASLLEASGVKTGLYTSPHFVHPSERILISGRRLPEDEGLWLEAAREAWQACPELTYFEILTVMALYAFRACGVQAAILEAGLGARWDATTAAPADAVCLAPMALDHTAVLGPAIEDIARDKACAIRSSAPVFSSPQPPEAAAIIAERARAFQAPLAVTEPLSADIQLGLAGAHQRVNAATALACARTMLDMLGVPAIEASLAQGLAGAFIPGRLQSVPETAEHPAFLLDGAHNPHGMASLASFLEQGGARPRATVYSCLHDKDWRTALGMLAKVLPGVPFLVPAMHNERAEAPEAILQHLREHGVREAASCLGLAEALAQAERAPGEGPVLVTGSLYLIADFFALHPDALERPARAACRHAPSSI